MANTNNTARVKKSKLYKKLTEENQNIFEVAVDRSTKAGIKVATTGLKKQTSVEIILPSTGQTGEKRLVQVRMTGRQVRALYTTLRDFYNTNDSE